MKNLIAIIVAIVCVVVAVGAVIISRQQQKIIQAENDALRQQIADDAKYTGIGKVGVGVYNIMTTWVKSVAEGVAASQS